MSHVVLTPAELDAYLRERVDTILISGHTNSSRTIHIPSDERWMQPVCGIETKHPDGWLDKPFSVYPSEYHPICTTCAEERFDVEVVDE